MTTTNVPERIRWAVDHLDVRPDDRVLEVGCGPGVAVSLVAERLVDGDGRVTAIDRSPIAVARTTARNAEHVDAGRAVVVEASFADLPPQPFEVVFAVNVNAFWVHPEGPEVAQLGALLAPRGAAHLCYETPSGVRADQLVTTLTAALAAHGFAPIVTRGPGPATVCVCVRSGAPVI